jgi:hypothetical protein
LKSAPCASEENPESGKLKRSFSFKFQKYRPGKNTAFLPVKVQFGMIKIQIIGYKTIREYPYFSTR